MAASIYIVTAINTVEDGSAVVVNWTQHATRNGAEEIYHTKCAAAARTTQYPVAAVTLTTNEGEQLYKQVYFHDVQPEPAPEQE